MMIFIKPRNWINLALTSVLENMYDYIFDELEWIKDKSIMYLARKL